MPHPTLCSYCHSSSPRSLRVCGFFCIFPMKSKFCDSRAHPWNQYYLNKWTLGCIVWILYIVSRVYSPVKIKYFSISEICKGYGIGHRRLWFPGPPVPEWGWEPPNWAPRNFFLMGEPGCLLWVPSLLFIMESRVFQRNKVQLCF